MILPSLNLNARRRALGLSHRALAEVSNVPLPTVKRILGGRFQQASVANVAAIAAAVGLPMRFSDPADHPDDFRERRAREKARRLVAIVQASSALEGQAVDPAAIERMVERTTRELLAGPSRRLWDD